MKSSIPMSDPNFSFADQRRERDASRRRLEPPPRRKSGPGWKVTGANDPEPPRWERVQSKGNTLHREVGPPPTSGGLTDPRHLRSRFLLEVTEGCFVGGYSAEPGDRVECWHAAAADLLSSGRGRVIEEHRNPAS
jgi:hypothetical protein